MSSRSKRRVRGWYSASRTAAASSGQEASATCETEGFLVGGFNPSEKYSSNWKSSPNRGENKKCLKPPPRFVLVDEEKLGLQSLRFQRKTKMEPPLKNTVERTLHRKPSGWLDHPSEKICVKFHHLLKIKNWLVVSTHLKNIRQIGNLPQIGVKIKNV